MGTRGAAKMAQYQLTVEDRDTQLVVLSAIAERLFSESRFFVHPVTYKMVWGDFVIDELEEKLEDVHNDAVDGFLEAIKYGGCGWDEVLLPQYKKLTMRSLQDGNGDPRGGGCKGYVGVEEFHWATECPNGITYRDLMEATYRMKGSKYDTWYESFGEYKYDTSHPVPEGQLSLIVEFAYGS